MIEIKIQNKIKSIIETSLSESKKVLLMCMSDNVKCFKDEYKDLPIFNMGASLEDVSKNIFTDLRKADKENVDLIIIQGVSSEGLGLAIMNRLLRACNYNLK